MMLFGMWAALPQLWFAFVFGELPKPANKKGDDHAA